MKVEINTELKTITFLEEVTLDNVAIFISGLPNLREWKLIPFKEKVTEYVPIYTQPYKLNWPCTNPWVQPYKYDYPNVYCNTTEFTVKTIH